MSSPRPNPNLRYRSASETKPKNKDYTDSSSKKMLLELAATKKIGGTEKVNNEQRFDHVRTSTSVHEIQDILDKRENFETSAVNANTPDELDRILTASPLYKPY